MPQRGIEPGTPANAADPLPLSHRDKRHHQLVCLKFIHPPPPPLLQHRHYIPANPLPAFSLPVLSIFLNFARFFLFFTHRNERQHTAILRRFLGEKHSKKKVVLVVWGIAPTKQAKVPLLQSQVQVQVCTSSFLQRVVCASPSSARPLLSRQNRQTTKEKSKL